MKPKISIPIINSALADLLVKLFPAAKVYNNPNQQNTVQPAFFINYMPHSGIRKQVGTRYIRKLFIDLVYLEEHNLTDLYDRYTAVAETLDENFETFTMVQNGIEFVLRTYERTWEVELAALHYKFNLEIHATIQTPAQPRMKSVEINKSIRKGE